MLETRQLLSAMPLGATPRDTGEFMLGRVAVTPVLLESNGTLDPNTEDWTPAEINQVLNNIETGMQWWVDTLATFNTPHTLEFVFDETFAVDPFETPYEPISRRSNSYTEYVGHFLQAQGYGNQGLTLEDAVRAFNHDQRTALDTDWSFTIFVVDSSNDIDGMFDPAGSFRQAFAFAGGLFMVVPSGRPASSYTHETGHMFWARDEYPGSGAYTERRGYYNTQNTNAVDGAPPGFIQEPSIMASGLLLQAAYDQNISAESTLAQIGWQDSDGDGIFDVLDVPLELDAAMVYSDLNETLSIQGNARAVPLLNRNSAGLKNDITLNRVSRLEVSVDGGPWTTVASPDQQVADFQFDVSIPAGFSDLQLRAVDATTGITSNIITLAPERPTSGGGNIDGFAYVDETEDGLWNADELLLGGVIATIQNPGPLVRGTVEPDDSPNTVYDSYPGLTLRSVGNEADGLVASFQAAHAATGDYGFFYRTIYGTWGNSWTAIKQEFEVVFDSPTTDVTLQAVGKQANSYGRLEAYDSSGNVIARATSGPLAVNESATLNVKDTQGRIARIKAFGTSGTQVALDALKYGPEISSTSATFGTFQFAGLPDGVYEIALQSPSSIYEVVDPNRTIEITAGVAAPLVVALNTVDSPWTNPRDPYDVNDNTVVQPLDALIIINALNRNGSRVLGAEDSGLPFVDVDGNGSISPIDALRVINFLNRNQGGGSGVGGASGEGSGDGDGSGDGASGRSGGFLGGGQGGTGEGEAFDDGAVTEGSLVNSANSSQSSRRKLAWFEATDRIMGEAFGSLLSSEDGFRVHAGSGVRKGDPGMRSKGPSSSGLMDGDQNQIFVGTFLRDAFLTNQPGKFSEGTG